MPHRPTILLVDDDPLVRSCVSLYLQDADYSVTTAENAQGALVCLEKFCYDLILLDLIMPEISGLELVRIVQQRNPCTPIIIFTGNATIETAIESLRLGVKDYLIKPVSMEETVASVNRVLSDQVLQKQKSEIIQDLKRLVNKLDGVENFSTANSDAIKPVPQIIHDRTIEWGSIIIDQYARKVLIDKKPVHLSSTSLDYLITLIRHAPEPVSHATLLLESQGFVEPTTKAKDIVRWRIYQLRKAIEKDTKNPRYIITVPGTGYCLAQ